jgi:hypothetical protein
VTSTLYRHGVVHSAADPFAEAILIDSGTVAWLGADDTADGLLDRADEVVDLDGAIVTPGFVDAHIHLLATWRALSADPAGGWSTGCDHDGIGAPGPGTAPAEVDRPAAYRQVLSMAAEHGIVAVHEMSTPLTDTRAGLAAAIELAADPSSRLPLVVGYRGELCVTAEDARALAAQIPGLTGIGGDLAVDGSFAARTARLRSAYADAPGELGRLQLSAEQIANHLGAVTRAGLQAGFHVVGDAALDEVLLGVRAAADVEGLPAVAAAGHRLEHADMVDASALATLALLGLRISAQPALGLDPAGTVTARLGASRCAGLRPFADLAQVGVPLAFGSDSPGGALDPWSWVAAAFLHDQPGQRISARAAFRAATRGGWRAAGMDHTGAGELRVGAPAHLAVWQAEELVVQAVDGRFTAWSSDARAGTPLLPAVGPNLPAPRCVRTVRGGVTLFDRLG